MRQPLLTVVVLLSLSATSLAGAVPQLQNDDGCSSRCCRAAKKKTRLSARTGLCCLVDCGRSAEPESYFTPNLQTAQGNRDSDRSVRLLNARSRSSLLVTTCGARSYSERSSSDRYLETGSLLI